MKKTTYKEIGITVLNHIIINYGGNINYVARVFEALRILLNTTYKNYGFPSSFSNIDYSLINGDDLQSRLSRINEKETRRKKEGVFYTDSDVTDFMVLNSLNQFVNPSSCRVYDTSTIRKNIKKIERVNIEKILRSTIFDPTCGAGAFLISALSQKIDLYKLMSPDRISLVDVIGTIFGNDIESVSTDITKLRLFFLVIDSFEEELEVTTIAKKISKCFSNIDIVDYKKTYFGKYDIIVGNPPYIEYCKYEGSIANDYGNVYADVMKNVATMLNSNGVLAFVVPLSYISTARMGSIREFVHSQTGKQLLLNFADRPDCLFSGVHQKLTIILAQKTKEVEGIYTSKYNHWYKSERENLFSNLTLERITIVYNRYWPKFGDSVGASIYKKILSYKGEDMLSLNKSKNTGSVFLNLRACFWMKAFSKDMKSNSYKDYHIDKSKLPFVMCLLNSSLFFLMWTIISDGWHVTNKELSFIRIPSKIPKQKKWPLLLAKLETRLETTKEYVGTKQVEYEYKHKLCKDIIDEIDDELKSVYKLSVSELKYIKTFNEKYRISDGA